MTHTHTDMHICIYIYIFIIHGCICTYIYILLLYCHWRYLGSYSMAYPFPGTITRISVIRIPAVHLRHLGLKQYRQGRAFRSTENQWEPLRTTLPGKEARQQSVITTFEWSSEPKVLANIRRVLLCTCRLLQTRSSTCVEPWQKDLERKSCCITLYLIWLKPTFGGIFTHEISINSEVLFWQNMHMHLYSYRYEYIYR